MPRVWDVVPRNQRSPFRSDILAGRVALITGGGSGIGLEIARQFGLHGAKVVIMGRRQQFLDKAVAALTADGVTAASISGDVRRTADCARAVEVATSSFGSLDILVNSAAGNFLAPAEALSPNGFKTVMEIDAQGVYNMSHASFAALKASRFGGNILNITATHNLKAVWYQSHASAAKAAIDSLTRCFALEWGEYGIRANGVAPGPIADTPGLAKLAPTDNAEEMCRHVAETTTSIGRLGTKFDIAMSCIFLACEGGSNITGETVVCDGGNWFHNTPAIPRAAVVAAARKVESTSRAKM
eukprot:TRINITY_DN2022_c0_g1_i2.p1 TRINITY_DN2022_c0_g1~~TRINITY_DN2022_c0_g1_i2.p1  ORF type:complete len:323 (+),score=87.69 TRINITY_DN2022_c0_g1_i2:75-971(+)